MRCVAAHASVVSNQRAFLLRTSWHSGYLQVAAIITINNLENGKFLKHNLPGVRRDLSKRNLGVQ